MCIRDSSQGEEFSLRNLPKTESLQLTFFPEESALLDELRRIDIESLSPIEALNILARWKEQYQR